MNGLIVCAGKGSRFGNKQKALSGVSKNKTLLDVNIISMSSVCSKIYICCHKSNEIEFSEITRKYSYVFLLPINHQNGDGHAILDCMINYHELRNDIIIKWGDSFHSIGDYKKIKKESLNGFNVLCQKEHKPYVKFYSKDNRYITDIKFSKYEKIESPGLHDLSIFSIKSDAVFYIAKNYHDKYFNGVKYNTKNGEFNLLQMIKESLSIIPANIILTKGCDNNSFNTQKEFDKFIKYVKEVNYG